MAQIKSALELALERTEDVKSDKEGIRLKELNEKGKRLASKFLNDHKDPEVLKKELSEIGKKDKEKVIGGVYDVFKANLTLPKDDEYGKELEVLKSGFSVIAENKKQLDMLFEQMDKFFTNYNQAKEQLEQGIKSQLEPLARQKSQQLSQQKGMDIELNPEDLPEYGQALGENMGRLDTQFQEALNNVKEELNGFLNQ